MSNCGNREKMVCNVSSHSYIMTSKTKKDEEMEWMNYIIQVYRYYMAFCLSCSLLWNSCWIQLAQCERNNHKKVRWNPCSGIYVSGRWEETWKPRKTAETVTRGSGWNCGSSSSQGVNCSCGKYTVCVDWI